MAALGQLKQILIASIPTFILVWILYIYVFRIFVRPLSKVLLERREATAGLREKADAAISRTELKVGEYEQAILSARADIYRMQEAERQKALEQKAGLLRDAHSRAGEMVSQARQEIQSDVESAKKGLAGEVEQLAAAIASAVVQPRTTAGGMAEPKGGL